MHMKESDLFEPIKTYFENLGYLVDGEVGALDMLLLKDDEHIVIELKNDLNFKLFLQGAKRQKIFNRVYLATWTPKNMATRAFKDKVYLAKRLGLGLILVSKRAKKINLYVEAEFYISGLETYQQRNKKRKEKLINELKGRRRRSNRGGSSNSQVLTSYKEDAYLILALLAEMGPLKASEIKQITKIDRAYRIVYNNHYGWFRKADKGIYTLTNLGEIELNEKLQLIYELKEANEVFLNDKN